MPPIRGQNSPVMKARNRSAILKLLLQHGPMPRQQIARALQLTPATITNATRELIELGLLTEHRESTKVRATARRSVPLAIDADGAFALGVNVGFTGIRLGVADLAGRVRFHWAQYYAGRQPDAVVEQIAAGVQEALQVRDIDTDRIVGIGVPVAGVVDTQQGIVRSHLGLGWQDVPLGALLAQALNSKVQLVNNVQTTALAESMYGAAADVDNFALVYVSTVIGTGIVMGGRLYQGMHSAAGMLGHLCVVPGGPLCTCGNRGCLEAVAGNLAVLEDAKRAIAGGRATLLRQRFTGQETAGDIRTVWEAAQQGDALARELLLRQAQYVGQGVANVLYLLDTSRVVLLTPDFDQHLDLGGASFLDVVRQTAQERVRLFDVQDRIVSSRLDATAPIQGGAAVIFSDFIESASFV